MSFPKPLLPQKNWWTRLKIAQKIGSGYSITIGIGMLGTLLGFIIGNYYEEKAEQKLLIAQQQKYLLVQLENAVLKVRAHPQEFFTALEQDIRFSYERSQFRGYAQEVEQLLNQIDEFISTHNQQLGVNHSHIEELRDNYQKTSREYIQLIESMLAEIYPLNPSIDLLVIFLVLYKPLPKLLNKLHNTLIFSSRLLSLLMMKSVL